MPALLPPGLGDGTLPNVPVNDLGWEIYPAGIVECCQKLHALLPELPIYITENGTADNNDAFRRRYLYEHLKVLSESGLPSPAITTGALWITSNGWRALLPALVLCISIPILMPAPSKRAESSMPI